MSKDEGCIFAGAAYPFSGSKQAWFAKADASGAVKMNPSYALGGHYYKNNNVSEHKYYEEKIRRLSSFPEFNPNPILEIGPGGNLLYANCAATVLAMSLGLSSPADFLPPDAGELQRKAVLSLEGRNFFREKELGERILCHYRN